MTDWNYKQPVEIIFGNGKISELAEILNKYKKPLLVSDPFFIENGLIDKIKNIVGNIDVFVEVSPNPDVSEVNKCSKLIKANDIDVIIALGGGSAIDLAKSASIKAEDIKIYFNGEKLIPKIHIPIIAVPTTAGTGSEVTCVSVLTDRNTGRKTPLVSEIFYPEKAIVDPELLYSLPPAVTASTGIDVLCHAVEGYWSKGHQPICDALAVYAIKTIIKYLPIAYSEPNNKKAREKTAEASVIAGLAFSLPKTTASHACSFPLTSIYHIPHGEACGLTLDYFARINAADKHTKSLAEELGYKDVFAFADVISELKEKVGLRKGIKDLNLSEEQTSELIRLSHHPNLNNNIIEITDEILSDLYEELKRK